MTITKNRLESDLQSQVTQASSHEIERWCDVARMYSYAENSLAVLSRLSDHVSHIYWGGLGELLGLGEADGSEVIPSIWEEKIFSCIHPDDIEKKHLSELRFYQYIKRLSVKQRRSLRMHTMLRMADAKGSYHNVIHRIGYVGQPLDGAISLALCIYSAANDLDIADTYIYNTLTGDAIKLDDISHRHILSAREREVLSLIAKGLSSKEIAEQLHVSAHTVSRHRQNVLEKLKATNSHDACRIAMQLGEIAAR